LGSVLNRVEWLFEGAAPIEISQEQRLISLAESGKPAPKPRGKTM
jgi:hypothetical protein